MNILGLQIFPGVEAVTDELVLRAPTGWGLPGARRTWSRPPAALAVSADARAPRPPSSTSRPATSRPPARSSTQPASFPEVVAMLFDAEAEPTAGRPLARSRTSWT